jgi:ribosome maturation protein Sdo1
MPLTSQEAFDLSQQFRDLAINIGNYRFANWQTLTPTQRRDIEDEEWSLINASSDMITKAVGLALDESETSVDSIKKSIKKAKSAIKKLEKVSQIITIAAAAVGLGAAIVSKDPGAIAKNAKLVLDAAKIQPA